MPVKKTKYSYPVQFFPRSDKDLLKDDPTESKNVIVPLEPEHFKYGIYFNDGYDYMSHLVSIEDFNNENLDLQELVKQNNGKCSMLSSEPIKSAKVIKEFEADKDCEGENVLEKIKEIAKDEIDEDLLRALDSDAEVSELEDDFVDIADAVNEKPVIKGDKDIFNQFFGNKIEDNDEVEETNDLCDFVSNIKKPINDISQQINFDRGYNELLPFKLSNSTTNSSKCTTMSKSFLNAFERMKYKENKNKEVIQPVDKDDLFYKGLYTGETEYDEKEVDKAVKVWSYRKPKSTKNAFDVDDKISKNQPMLMTVEKSSRKRSLVDSMMDVVDEEEEAEVDSEENSSELRITDVSQFHVPRPKDETAEEKRDRKKSIKSAKRLRQEEKKISRETYKLKKRT